MVSYSRWAFRKLSSAWLEAAANLVRLKLVHLLLGLRMLLSACLDLSVRVQKRLLNWLAFTNAGALHVASLSAARSRSFLYGVASHSRVSLTFLMGSPPLLMYHLDISNVGEKYL